MSSKNQETRIEMDKWTDKFEKLLKICETFDDTENNLRYEVYKEFCETLYAIKKKKKKEETSRVSHNFKKEQKVETVVKAAINIINTEYKIKILKVLMIYWNKDEISDEDKYEEIKEQILSIIPPYSFESIFALSERFITSECDKSYFELCFLLNENHLKKFEFEFENLLSKYKRFYGEYFKHAMKKECGRYLIKLAKNLKYDKTIEYIFQKCPFIEQNSNIKTEFEEIKEFIQILDEKEVKEEDKHFGNDFRKLVKNFENLKDSNGKKENTKENPKDNLKVIENDFRASFNKLFEDNEVTRKRLFCRFFKNDTSLIEDLILKHDPFIFECAWNQLKLWTRPEIFAYKNPSGKTLIDYAIESKNNRKLLFLLMPKNKEDPFDQKKHFMLMKINQYFNQTSKCIIKLLLEFSLRDKYYKLFPNFAYLLEEIGVVNDLESEEKIKDLIILSQQGDFSKYHNDEMDESSEDDSSDYDSDEYSEESLYEDSDSDSDEDGDEDDDEDSLESLRNEALVKVENLFYVDHILGNMIVYWNTDCQAFPKYKKKLEKVNPFYKLMFLIIERKGEEFCQNFQQHLIEMEESFDMRYKDAKRSEEYSSRLLFTMLLAAIKTNQREIIDLIFDNDAFSRINFDFPSNIVPEEIHYYTALKFLKYNYRIGQGKIPKDWMTAEVLEEFFDSQISYNSQEFIEIDCSSLNNNQKALFNAKSNIKLVHIMNNNMESLEYITTQENLKELVTHPVIEIFINLKNLKYQRMFTWNFWIFVIFFVFPFTMLIIHNNVLTFGDDVAKREINKMELIFWSVMKHIHFIGILFLFIRESFQFYHSEPRRKYLRKMSNLFEIALLSLSIGLSVATFMEHKTCIRVFEVGFILFSTISATSMLPFAHVPMNMQILKKVALTFLRIFYTFATILIAFSFSFCVMFQDIGVGDNDGKKNVNDDADDNPMNNFKYPHHALVKIITMLSGEYEIQPASLDLTSLLFFSVFIITSFILFNLILGLSIEDVQELKKSSRAFDLITKSERFIEVSKKLHSYLYDLDKSKLKPEEIRKEKISEDNKSQFDIRIIKFFLSKYIYLHIINKVLINIKTNEVFVQHGEEISPVLMRNPKDTTNEKYYISDETFKDIQSIITKKNRKVFEQLMSKIEKEQEKLNFKLKQSDDSEMDTKEESCSPESSQHSLNSNEDDNSDDDA